jgi:hypothetical protein
MNSISLCYACVVCWHYVLHHVWSQNVVFFALSLVWLKDVSILKDLRRTVVWNSKRKSLRENSAPLRLHKGKIVPVLKYLNTMPWIYKCEWTYSYAIIDLGTRWRRVVSFTPPSL